MLVIVNTYKNIVLSNSMYFITFHIYNNIYIFIQIFLLYLNQV